MKRFIVFIFLINVAKAQFGVDSVYIHTISTDSVTFFASIMSPSTPNLFNGLNTYSSNDTSYAEICLTPGFGPAIDYFDSTYIIPFNTVPNKEEYFLTIIAKGNSYDTIECKHYDTAYYSFQRPISPIKELFNNDDVLLYPNPVRETLTLNGINESEIEEIHVYSMLGKRVMSTNVPEKELNLQSITKGSYIIKIKTANGSIIRQILKE